MEFTEEYLKQFDGSDSSKPIYLAIRERVFDVSRSKCFYGTGGPYSMFAGKNAGRALAKMSKDVNDVTGDLSGLTEIQVGVLDDWEAKFLAKYPIVGRISAAS